MIDLDRIKRSEMTKNKLVKMDVPQTVQMEIQKCPICKEIPVVNTTILNTFRGHTSIDKQVAVCNSCGLTAPLDKWNSLSIGKDNIKNEEHATMPFFHETTVCKYCQVPVEENRFGTNFGVDIVGDEGDGMSICIAWGTEPNDVPFLLYSNNLDDIEETFQITNCPKCGRKLTEE